MKSERRGIPLVQDKYQKGKDCDKREREKKLLLLLFKIFRPPHRKYKGTVTDDCGISLYMNSRKVEIVLVDCLSMLNRASY
jgi:hypothetical protein